MAKKRTNGDGNIRKRKDGRRKGIILKIWGFVKPDLLLLVIYSKGTRRQRRKAAEYVER